MARDRNTNFKVPENEKRAKAKKERGRGKLAMGNYTQVEWTQKHDPLFKVGGKERHLKMKQIR